MGQENAMVSDSSLDVQINESGGAVAHSGPEAGVLRPKGRKMDVCSVFLQAAWDKARTHDGVQQRNVASMDHYCEVHP
jgi:hypothetical protein